MGSPSIINFIGFGSSHELTRQNTQNLQELIELSNRNNDRFKEPQVPEIQIKQKQNNFEIKL